MSTQFLLLVFFFIQLSTVLCYSVATIEISVDIEKSGARVWFNEFFVVNFALLSSKRLTRILWNGRKDITKVCYLSMLVEYVSALGIPSNAEWKFTSTVHVFFEVTSRSILLEKMNYHSSRCSSIIQTYRNQGMLTCDWILDDVTWKLHTLRNVSKCIIKLHATSGHIPTFCVT